MALIEFEQVSKAFPHGSGSMLLRGHILSWFNQARPESFFALKKVSFRLEPGESLGVIGSNGAGKSTLLSLVAGLAKPSAGRIKVNGRIAALLELGSGFHPDLTGGENLILNASLLGLSRRKTMQIFERVVDFSGIGEFINEPLRTYSSGMIMRLAFSVAINVDPDILLVDEILAVGDANFQVKSYQALVDLRRRGKSLLLVSHSTAAIKQMCDRAMWLDHGKLVLQGQVGEVIEAYEGRSILKLEAAATEGS